MRRIMPEDWVLPALDKFNRAFFTSGRIVLQECAACGTVQHPPEEVCHQCLGMEFRARETDGLGEIYSFIVVHHPVAPALRDVVPYVIVLISLDEIPAVRILGNVVNRRPDELAIGMKVRATFETVPVEGDEDALLLPQWEVIDVTA